MRCVCVDGARSAEPPISHGTFLAMPFKTLPDESRVARPFASAREGWHVFQPIRWQVAILHAIDLVSEVGILFSIIREQNLPFLPQRRAAGGNAFLEQFVDAARNEELGVFRPAVDLLCRLDLFLAQRLAMGAVRVLLVRGAPGDVAIDHDKRI